eukprot:1158667-Pelagomonas_calceolata.AAC.5
MNSAIHILSGCQCPVNRNIVTEQHYIATVVVLISKGYISPPRRPQTPMFRIPRTYYFVSYPQDPRRK